MAANNGVRYGGYGVGIVGYGGANTWYNGSTKAYGNPIPSVGYVSSPLGAPRRPWSNQAPYGYGVTVVYGTATPSNATGVGSGAASTGGCLNLVSNVMVVRTKEEKAPLEGPKTDPGESSKDSDFSFVSNLPSMPQEEEDLGWDEIEDLDNSDEKKEEGDGSPNRADLPKRLSATDEDENLTWDIQDDDEPVKS
ncbi:hypothetical protein NE237_014821 [Protea cynaroides]|uniref:Uncharacterized protein n=1 Tax=Protea cynaroides TaxID=273540 RepID=A0A9Q0KCV1_9MAGN|nr:hypothetical protein NE237_014821 [Protea cynaroides]